MIKIVYDKDASKIGGNFVFNLFFNDEDQPFKVVHVGDVNHFSNIFKVIFNATTNMSDEVSTKHMQALLRSGAVMEGAK